ncbi:MAG: enoyl-CoA hydratase/isomerase family protein [Deltaproteobacteria bacterium]|nr:enoyl-CoA hydratase/isomerase family protein [Deltaproteobacteria bacterium]
MSVVLYEKIDKTAVITLNRPEVLNALNSEVWQLLIEAWRKVVDDPDVWTAILTGAGERAFSAGADLKEMTERKAQADRENRPFVSSLPEVSPAKGMSQPKPLIAAINGIATGGGLELALICDIRICSDHARFGFAEVKRGIMPGAGGTQRLPRIVPLGSALEVLMTGDFIGAEEAYRIGLVNRVVPASKLMTAAQVLANRINENGPLAVRAVKEAAYRGLQMPLNEGLHLETLLLSRLRQSEDAWEGPKAFAEKRKPIYKGR